MFRSKAVRFAAILGVLALVGCSTTPVGPVASSDGEPVLLSRVSRGGAGAASPINLYAEQWMSSATGGQLVLLDVVLDVPPAAVSSDTLFWIFIPDDEVFYNEFGTSGLVFDVPVTVTMSYRDAELTGIDQSTIRIAWRNDAAGTWENVECALDQVNQTVTAQLNHFSAYGLISDAKSGGE